MIRRLLGAGVRVARLIPCVDRELELLAQVVDLTPAKLAELEHAIALEGDRLVRSVAA